MRKGTATTRMTSADKLVKRAVACQHSGGCARVRCRLFGQGLTLVEVMISLAIFGILVFFVLRVFDFGSLQKRESDEITRQAEIAEYIAVMIASAELTPPLGASADSISWPPGGDANNAYLYQLECQAPSAPANVTLCAITVAPKNVAAFSAGSPDNYNLIVPVE